jgi:hypothetical protein
MASRPTRHSRSSLDELSSHAFAKAHTGPRGGSTGTLAKLYGNNGLEVGAAMNFANVGRGKPRGVVAPTAYRGRYSTFVPSLPDLT